MPVFAEAGIVGVAACIIRRNPIILVCEGIGGRPHAVHVHPGLRSWDILSHPCGTELINAGAVLYRVYCRIGTPPRLLSMRAFHSAGPVWWTEVPFESTATVTGMSTTSNS